MSRLPRRAPGLPGRETRLLLVSGALLGATFAAAVIGWFAQR